MNMLYRLPLVLGLLSLLSGCTLDMYLEELPSGAISIVSPAAGETFKSTEGTSVVVNGTCGNAVSELTITSPIRDRLSCVNGKWSYTLDLNLIPEGEFAVRVETPQGKEIANRSYQKRDLPSHFLFSRKEKELSKANFISQTYTADGDIAYSSDEVCQPSGCATNNIVLRLSGDSYSTPYFITRDMNRQSIQSSIAVLPDGNLRIFYRTINLSSGLYGLYYKDFDRQTKTAGPEVVMLPDSANVTDLEVNQSENSFFYLRYISLEYCQAHSCNYAKVSLRKYTGSSSSVEYPANHNTCAVTNATSSFSRNGDLHLVYTLTQTAGCGFVTGNPVEYKKLSAGAWTAPVEFNPPHTGNAIVAADKDGRVFVFYHGHQSWEGGQGCSNWDLRFRTSEDSFRNPRYVSGGCTLGSSYPGTILQPAITYGDDGTLYLLTSKNSGNDRALTISKSTDNFSTSIEFDQQNFTIFSNYKLRYKDGKFQIVHLKHVDVARIERLVVSADGTINIRQVLTDSFKKHLNFFQLASGQVGLVGLSKEWCLGNGCSNENYYLENISTKEKTWLTKIKKSDLVLSNSHLVKSSGTNHMFIYASNEQDSTNWNTVVKSSADSYTSSQFLTPVSSGTFSIPTSVDYDQTGKVHLMTYQSTGMIYHNTSDSFSTGVVLTTERINSNISKLSARKSDGAVLASYNSSDGAAWKSRFKWSSDSFSSLKYALDGVSYATLWNSSDEAEIFNIEDGNADGLKDIRLISSKDNFATGTTLISYANKTVCGAAGPSVAPVYSGGYLYIAFSASEKDSSICKLYMKRSDDWSKSWPLSYNETTSYSLPQIFAVQGKLPIVCARSNFEAICFDTSKATLVQD